MKRKIISTFLCLTMAVSLLVGCGSSESENGKNTVELVLWSIATESDTFHPAYLKAIAEFEASHPGVTIKFEAFANESYKTKIKSAIAANELPDIFFTWAGGFSKPFVESGKVLELDSYYDTYKEELPGTVLENVTYDGRLYGSVITTPISVIFYNKKMFAEQGVKAPTTWDEWKQVCQKFSDAGITPIGVSAKDTWVLAMTHDAIALKLAGSEKLRGTLLKEEGSYTDEVFLDAATKLKELGEMGAFSKSAIGLSNDEASADFYAGKTAMYITGSWMAGSIQTDTENPSDFGVMPVPVLNSDHAAITDFMGGASDTLMAASASRYPDLAAAAVFELTRGISKYAYLDGVGIPAWKIDYDDSSVNALSKEVAEYAAKATSFTLWFDILMEAEDAGEYLVLLQELYAGTLTPEEFTAAMAEQLGK